MKCMNTELLNYVSPKTFYNGCKEIEHNSQLNFDDVSTVSKLCFESNPQCWRLASKIRSIQNLKLNKSFKRNLYWHQSFMPSIEGKLGKNLIETLQEDKKNRNELSRLKEMWTECLFHRAKSMEKEKTSMNKPILKFTYNKQRFKNKSPKNLNYSQNSNLSFLSNKNGSFQNKNLDNQKKKEYIEKILTKSLKKMLPRNASSSENLRAKIRLPSVKDFFPINFVPCKIIQTNNPDDNVEIIKNSMHNRSQSDYFSHNPNQSQMTNHRYVHRVCPIVNLFYNIPDYSSFTISFKQIQKRSQAELENLIKQMKQEERKISAKK